MMQKLVLLSLLLALAGCSTIDGIGQDISGGSNRVAGWIE